MARVMEDAMPSLRIIVAGAIFLVMAANGAAAQTATDTAPGKPMPLLQILAKSFATRPKPHVKIARKAARKFARKTTNTRHIVAKEDPTPVPPPVRTATPTAPANIWPGLNYAADGDAAAVAPTPDVTSAPADSALSEIVVGGQTVQIASPDTVNDIDRAADHPDAAEDAALKSDFVQATPTAAQAVVAAPSQRDTSAVGSASWIAKVLAALGGAIAAGSTAWFMIGSAPRRTFS
jgi:hypothetical protein